MNPDSVVKTFEGLTLAVLGIVFVLALVTRGQQTAQLLQGLGGFYGQLVGAFLGTPAPARR